MATTYRAVPLLPEQHPTIRAYTGADPHAGCHHRSDLTSADRADTDHWCMWDQSTWIDEFDVSSRESVRRAMLQAKIELSMAQLARDTTGTNGAFRAYQRVSRIWSEVK